MQFIIMDLEWNNTYAKKIKGYLNEIIEIGAVKIDSNLNCVDSYSVIIRSQIGKKLRGSVKKLTNLTNDDIHTGIPFSKAFADLRKWIGSEETVVLTWGDGDIRVLIENYAYLNGISVVPFISNYCDLQLCFQRKMKTSSGQQIGLRAAAEMLGIDPEEYTQHRALGDSLLTGEIFRRIYNHDEMSPYFRVCNAEFYKRLSFKAKVIRNIDNPLVDKSKLCHSCSHCKTSCEQITGWKYHNQFFRATYHCPKCGKDYAVGVKFKKLFDRVDVRKIESVIEPESIPQDVRQGE